MSISLLVVFFILVIPSAIIHEYAHGFVADKLGDPTARYAGRLTLNPLAHIYPVGTLLLPIFLAIVSAGSFIFAYAKPVPYNPYNLKYPKWGPALVGAAGPAANILLALVFGIMVRFTPAGSLQLILAMIVYVNVLLAVFNMVPLPPLDGSKVLFALLPRSMNHIRVFLERYGMILLLVFIFFAFQLILPIIDGLFRLFAGFSFF